MYSTGVYMCTVRERKFTDHVYSTSVYMCTLPEWSPVQYPCVHVYSTRVYMRTVSGVHVQYLRVYVYSTCVYICTVPVCTYVQYLCVHVYSTWAYTCTVPGCTSPREQQTPSCLSPGQSRCGWSRHGTSGPAAGSVQCTVCSMQCVPCAVCSAGCDK